MTLQELSAQSNESEISLLDIVNFLQESWKKLAISAIIGAILGISGWFVLGNYSADYVLLNNNNNNNSYTLDLVSWKILQKSLPNLADQIIDENKAPENLLSLYKEMSSDRWWQKNVVPTYALSKADTKDLAGISKDLDAASTTIINLTLTATGPSKEQSIENVRAAAKFLRTGSAYLQLRSMLNSYESLTMSTDADVRQKITSTQIEIGYQQERARQLEELHKRFPGGNAPAQQVVDAQDSSAKYLPLQTQIIAANNDINTSKEALSRLQRRLDQIALIKEFLQLALPLQDQTFDGLTLDQQLLDIEAVLRKKLTKNDSNSEQFLNDLHARLLDIQVRFTNGLEANTAPTSSGKKGVIKATSGGFALALFLMLLVLLGQKVWQSIKSRSTM
ncbi:hypothetical protein FD961_01600 [Polynucleobacter sp. TSB-Sco08W16]|uniref:hypothetical protein n=1 Tax=Polynucleobacter sp. TSB-Sco08W16 TaxID=1758374 RepID=UPI001BFDEDBA|nr:hypothetical protein [Polynucleobacter sp. TSB-Sco08W16]QWD74552.1 hypothetical protein FD961_01600 [Polynucleobacter sp. TSB-Sco08W16]